jgi:hypothetical protein
MKQKLTIELEPHERRVANQLADVRAERRKLDRREVHYLRRAKELNLPAALVGDKLGLSKAQAARRIKAATESDTRS